MKMITSDKYCLFFVLIFLLFGFAENAKGQNHLIGEPEILNFSKFDYQGGTQNWSITQDENGVLFFGNNKGVLEFDGTNWRLFDTFNKTIVRSLQKSEENKIYVGAQDEFGFLAYDNTGKLKYYSLIEAIPESDRSFEDVWKIFVIEEKVFFCSRKAVFILWKNEIEVVKAQGRFENFFELQGELFAQDIEVGLLVWNGTQFKLINGDKQFRESRIAAILPYKDKKLIISDFKGLFLMEDDKIEAWETPTSSFLMKHQAYCAIKLVDGSYAIGTAQNGLVIMDTLGIPNLHLNKASGLQNNTVLSVFQDRYQNFWLGLDNGIDYIKINNPFSLLQSDAGIEGTGYVSILHEGKLYLGTNQGLFYIDWSEEQGIFDSKKFEKIDNLKGQIWNLNLLENELIVCSHDGAFYLRNNQAIPLMTGTGIWKFIQLNGHPNFAIAGTYQGLLLFKKKSIEKGMVWEFSHKIKGFEESARVFEQDDSGNIWVSHSYKGLFKVRLNETFTDAQVSFYDSSKGLPTNTSINVTKIKGEIVITTPMGAYLYNNTEDQFVAHQKLNAILGGTRNINRLIEDKEGKIWFSIENEFGILDVKESGFLEDIEVKKHYFNHIQENLVNGFENIYAIDKNNVLIASEKGFILYNPSKEKEENIDFGVLIRQVICTSGKDSILYDGSLNKFSQENFLLTLPHYMNSLHFSYSAPFFEHFKHIQYRYKLQGFEDKWSDWSYRTDKEFTNLPHKSYEFQLEAKNANSQISKKTIVKFIIRPPWYATIFAKTAYFILIALFLVGLFRYFSIKLTKEKEAIIKEQERTLEIKEAAFKEEQEKSEAAFKEEQEKSEAAFKEEQEKSEAEIIRLRNENLLADIKHKNSQLASATMHLVQKGEIILRIKKELKKLLPNAVPDNKRKLQEIIHTIDGDIRLDDNWEQFEIHFDQVHENFLKNLRKSFPKLTPKDQKLCAYLRMNLTTKEIAPLLNISVRGVEISRYRLRKKLELESEDNLVDFIMQF